MLLLHHHAPPIVSHATLWVWKCHHCRHARPIASHAALRVSLCHRCRHAAPSLTRRCSLSKTYLYGSLSLSLLLLLRQTAAFVIASSAPTNAVDFPNGTTFKLTMSECVWKTPATLRRHITPRHATEGNHPYHEADSKSLLAQSRKQEDLARSHCIKN